MSFDGIVTYAAAKEFRDRLSMGKIEKIYHTLRYIFFFSQENTLSSTRKKEQYFFLKNHKF